MEVSNSDRIIVLVDMDCFYVQVEQKLCPEYQNKPCAVVQYNTWKGGGIIAVNYEARAKGVTRFLRGGEAQKVCPEIHLFRVPEIRGKADLTKYREAGASVIDVLCSYSDCVERASIDEAYLDMTSLISSRIQNAPNVTAEQLQNTFVVGWEGENPESRKEELEKWLQMIYEEEHLHNERMLALAAVIVEEMRTAVYEKTGYRCSAGIAHNKVLSKLSCGLHKPNKQTVLPQTSIQLLFKTIPIKKVRNLGGKLGEAIAKKFNVEKMGDLVDIPKSQLVNLFGEKTGNWLYGLVRGIDTEPVTARQLPKSIGCGKNFPGKKSLGTKKDVVHWLKQLTMELEERLIKDQNDNRRFARLLTVSVRYTENGVFSVVSRSCPIQVYNSEKLAHDALVAISKLNTSSSDTIWKPSIWMLSMAASKFEDKLDSSHCNIESYFSKGSSSINTSIASASTGCNDSDQSISLSSKLSKSFKNETADKSIVSYFKKKQDTEVKSFEKIETLEADKDINEENKELDSFLSACNDMNNTDISNDESNDSKIKKVHATMENTDISNDDSNDSKITKVLAMMENTDVRNVDSNDSKTTKVHTIIENADISNNESNDSKIKKVSTIVENTETVSQNKLTEFLEVKAQSACNITNFIGSYDDQKTSTVNLKAETILPNNPLGFFEKKLKGQSKLSFDKEVETSFVSINNKFNESKSDESFDGCGSKTALSDNDSKPLGFFAKKMKEKSESNFRIESKSNFSVESETSCDSLNNQTEQQEICNSDVPSPVLTCEQTSCNISDSDNSCLNLDPDLTKVCEECNKCIPIWEETEHLDYHFALKMSKEFTNIQRTNKSASVATKNVVQKSKSGRKRGSVAKSSSQSKKPLVQTKTIDSFFR